MKRTLLIVDPQYDFIYGSLAVESGERAINNVIKLLEKEGETFDFVVVTLDEHPFTHMSFKPFGGIWPPHCRKYTKGAAIHEDLVRVLADRQALNYPILFVEKGRDLYTEEYSAFEHSVVTELSSADEIVVCGIAGDFCVLNTVKDLLAHKIKGRIRLFIPGIASIDDGTVLNKFIEENNLELID